jgi:putative ABC transport system substrate-binding protein
VKRRAFIAALGSATTWTLATRAQQAGGVRRIGALIGVSGPDAEARATALVQGLAGLNWREGDNLHIDWRWAGGETSLYERYAAELAALGPDLLFAQGSLSVEALHRQTSIIPIVFTIVTDPVGQGIVASLARPGGNVTGFSSYDPQMAGKWLEMLMQIKPPVAHVVVLFDPVTAPFSNLMMREIEEAARSFALPTRRAQCHSDADIEAALASLAHEARGGLVIMQGTFTDMHRDLIVALAARYRLPAVYPTREFVIARGLMSYGVDNHDLSIRAANYIDRIFKGTKPADLPIERPTKFELVINLKTAKALGIAIPPSLLARADEVIE